MAVGSRDLKSLTWLLPTGALGVSVALASATANASPADGARLDPTAKAAPVAERLQAIRNAVSHLTVNSAATPAEPNADPNILPAWWGNWHPWGNWGWHPGWGNGWHNGGWGNWHNAPWGNWHNYWRNW